MEKTQQFHGHYSRKFQSVTIKNEKEGKGEKMEQQEIVSIPQLTEHERRAQNSFRND